MKIVKELVLFYIVCYISCCITKLIMNGFLYNKAMFIDSIYIAIGCTIGWGIVRIIERKIK